MRNLFKARIAPLVGFIVCAAVIGFTMADCDDLTIPGTSGGDSQSLPGLPGTITISPSGNVTLGTKLTAVYSSNSVEVISYQWKQNTTYVGTNSNEYTPTETGSYTVTASAIGYQSKTSAAVTILTSLPDLSGTVSITPNTGVLVNTELTATYNGTETVSYRWNKDGTAIPDATSNKYTPTEPGDYTVTISAAGYHSKTSAAVTVYPPNTTVAARPVITKEPNSANYGIGETAVPLSVEATVSAGTLSYQWYTNDIFNNAEGQIKEISSATSATSATYDGVTTTTAGDTFYFVKITNTDTTKDIATTTVTSSPVRIRVTATAGGLGTPAATITVDTTTKYQYVSGFGGMSNVWDSPALYMDDIDQLFSQDGFGYNLFRICIYPYLDDLFNGVEPAPAGDPTAHTRYYEMVSRAKSHGAKILATPWTPPAEWKSNKTTNGGGYLLPEHWNDYALHLRGYIDRMAANNAAIDYISIQNEPDIDVSYEGCKWTAEETRDFMKQYARTIAPANGPVKIMPGESYKFDDSFYAPIFADTEATAAIDLIGGHIYSGGLTRHTNIINAGKEVWMTEHNTSTPSNYNIDPQWGRVWLFVQEVHDCMAADFSAYIWWYSKRYYSFVGDGTAGTLNGQPLYRGYALSHYAKYAAGKTRVGVTVTGITANTPLPLPSVTTNPPPRDSVYVTAYESDSEITLVLFNRNDNTAIGTAHIVLPVEVSSASMVMTQGDRASQNDPNTGPHMTPQVIIIGPDKKTIEIEVPKSCIISVRFTK